ncbi:MAG TPA: GtrA family protein, partial [Xanthobacteraceae bacterium]|nr:GtrA family protein [Xanthobacteraceae bacterium]
MAAGAMREPSFGTLVGLAWLVIATDLIVRYWAGTGLTLGDTDDAMRLVQLRDFLGGQGWFDLHQPRLGPPVGYDSHWSRLID